MVTAAIGVSPVRGAEPAVEPLRLASADIDGSLMICGGGKLPDTIKERFVELAGGREARLVVIPTASSLAERGTAERYVEPWKAFAPESVVMLHTESKEAANDPAFIEPLKQATGVWLGGGNQTRLAEMYLGTLVEKELYALLKRGGVVAGTSAGAAVQSRVMIAHGYPEPAMGTGFDLLPGAVIDQHFVKRRRLPRLMDAVARHPHLVGFGTDEGTALIVRGRKIEVLGESTVTVVLPPTEAKPPRQIVLESNTSAELTSLCRMAMARAAEAFPPDTVAAPKIEKGSLLFSGGGELPESATRKFIELAGGPEALIVVVPTAGPDPVPAVPEPVKILRAAGAKNVRVLHGRTPEEVEAPRFLATLEQAGGLWFGGGRPWRLVNAYAGTKAQAAFCGILTRGGVIGGNSAGASVLAEFMVRANPLLSAKVVEEGYERGFGLLPGVVVDHHFTEHERQADMQVVLEACPPLLGIGIDADTALLVEGQTATVFGRGKVHFFSRDEESTDTACSRVEEGRCFDLKRRCGREPETAGRDRKTAAR